MEIVKKWINSDPRDYNAGVDLYAKYGKNNTLLQTFRRKKTTKYCEEKLLRELQKIAQVEIVPTQVLPTDEPRQSERIHVNPVIAKNEVSTEVGAYIDGVVHLRKQLNLERAKLSNQLKDCTTDEERKSLIDRIKPLRERINEATRQIKYADQQNKVPDFSKGKKDNELPEDAHSLIRLRNNARSRISKAKSKIQNLSSTDPKINKYEKSIKEDMNLINEINKKIPE